MNIEIGGKWTFIPPKYGIIGFDPSPYVEWTIWYMLHGAGIFTHMGIFGVHVGKYS
jgi:hypothetical protein